MAPYMIKLPWWWSLALMRELSALRYAPPPMVAQLDRGSGGRWAR